MSEQKLRLKLDPRYLVYLGVFLICVVAASANSTSSFHTQKAVSGENFLDQQIEVPDQSASEIIQTQTQEDWNTIQNMKNGDVSWSDAKKHISDDRYWAKQRVSLNTEEEGANQRYIDYLNTGLDCIYYYSNFGADSEQFQNEMKVLEYKKGLI
jgi:hypothetical protein